MNCETCQTQLPEYVDGALSGDVREALDAHVETCEACRAALAGERKALAGFAGLLDADLDQRRLDEDMRRRLASAGWSLTGAKGVESPGGRFAWSGVLALAAVLLILVGGWGIYQHLLSQPPTAGTRGHGRLVNADTPWPTNVFRQCIQIACMSNSQERFAMNTVERVSL